MFLDGIIEKLHASKMPARMKAQIAMDVASVHETEGRVCDAIVALETAAFLCPRAPVAKPLLRLRRRLPP